MAIVNPASTPAIGSTEVDRATAPVASQREAAPDAGSFEDALEQQSDGSDETVVSPLKLSGGIRPHLPPAVLDDGEAPEAALAATAEGSDDASLATDPADEAAAPDLSVFKTGIRPHLPPAETPEEAADAQGAAAVESEAAGQTGAVSDPLPADEATGGGADEAASEEKTPARSGADAVEMTESPKTSAEMTLLLAQRAAKSSRQSLETFLLDAETTRKDAPGNRFSGQA